MNCIKSCVLCAVLLLPCAHGALADIQLVVEESLSIPYLVFDVQHWEDEESYGFAYAHENVIWYATRSTEELDSIVLSDTVAIHGIKLMVLDNPLQRLGVLVWWSAPTGPVPNERTHKLGIVDLASAAVLDRRTLAFTEWGPYWGIIYSVEDMICWPPPPATTRWVAVGGLRIDSWEEMHCRQHSRYGGAQLYRIDDGQFDSNPISMSGYWIRPFAQFGELNVVTSGFENSSRYGSDCPPWHEWSRSYLHTTHGSSITLCDTTSYWACDDAFACAVGEYGGNTFAATVTGTLFDAATLDTVWSGNFTVSRYNLFAARLDSSFDDRILIRSGDYFNIYSSVPFEYLGRTSSIPDSIHYVLRSEGRLDRFVTRSGGMVRIYRPNPDYSVPRIPVAVTMRALGNTVRLRWQLAVGAISYRIYGGEELPDEFLVEVTAPANSITFPVPHDRYFFALTAVYP